MNNKDTIKSILLILKNLNFDNGEIIERQLVCVRDLVDTILLDVTKDKKCPHPEEMRKNFTTMGDTQKTEQCQMCGEIIISEFKG